MSQNTIKVLNNFSDIVDTFFKDAFASNGIFEPVNIAKFNYPTDVVETEKELRIEIAAIGIDKDDIKISYANEVLKISYERKEETKEETATVHHRGISRRSFSQSYAVGRKYNVRALKSTLDKGLLTIVIPKAEDAKPIDFVIE